MCVCARACVYVLEGDKTKQVFPDDLLMSTESVSLSDCYGEVQEADWSQSNQLG